VPIQQRQQVLAAMFFDPIDIEVRRFAIGRQARFRTRMTFKKDTHAARWGLLRGYSIYSNEVGGLRYDRLNPKGVLPPDKDSDKSEWSQ